MPRSLCGTTIRMRPRAGRRGRGDLDAHDRHICIAAYTKGRPLEWIPVRESWTELFAWAPDATITSSTHWRASDRAEERTRRASGTLGRRSVFAQKVRFAADAIPRTACPLPSRAFMVPASWTTAVAASSTVGYQAQRRLSLERTPTELRSPRSASRHRLAGETHHARCRRCGRA